MKILFAYFGQPRCAFENLPNHLKLIEQIKQQLILHDPTQVDLLYATTPIDTPELDKVKKIIDRCGINAKFDFITDFDRIAVSRDIQSKLINCDWSPKTILSTLYQPIAIHLLAKKVKKEYDAIFIMRTDVVYCTYDNNFDFSYLMYHVKERMYEKFVYVATMEYRISTKMTPVHADDKVLLTGKTVMKELFENDFALNVAAFLEDSDKLWGKSSIHHINDNHATNFWFLVNSHMIQKLQKTNIEYSVSPYRIMPRHEITRTPLKNTSIMTDAHLTEVENEKIKIDKTIDKTFKINPSWFDQNGF
jgi:hypothetical protein